MLGHEGRIWELVSSLSIIQALFLNHLKHVIEETILEFEDQSLNLDLAMY